MRCSTLLLAASLLGICRAAALQTQLEDLTYSHRPAASRPLHGRFLHITDLHPDPFYKAHSSTDDDHACHHGKGHAGTYGTETSSCDTPYALVNATFKWIEENLRDRIDFVIWTGDSARHDSDERIPRTRDELLSTNRWIVKKFGETFSKLSSSKDRSTIPVIPTFGNNDILPHNIFLSGPNKWLKTYADIWSDFIPEEQRHGFKKGGWFYVEVIPNKLAVFSLNTLYFFSNNAAVDGCSIHSEPGFQHFEWLRIQLQFLRERGMKAILTGHVPPARTDSKQLWDESCWQKYTLWLQQYRDVVIGGIYGHMNVDHFMLQDTKQVIILENMASDSQSMRATMDDELTIHSASNYLEELRNHWSDLPDPTAIMEIQSDFEESKKKKKHRKSKKEKLLEKFGGPWCERFQVTNVGPSVVPNYFPTLRVIEYNITGLSKTSPESTIPPLAAAEEWMDWLDADPDVSNPEQIDDQDDDDQDLYELEGNDQSVLKKKKKKKHGKKPKKPDFVLPSPPSKSSPPGPAYSPQTLTMLGYTQYFANLTHINNEPAGKHAKSKKPHVRPFKYEVEYDTFTDPVYKLKDMTVQSFLRLAYRIGQYEPEKEDRIDEYEDLDSDDAESTEDDSDEYETDDDVVHREKKKKKKKHRKQHKKNKVWLQFIRYAFVGTLDEDELQKFNQASEAEFWNSTLTELHDGEL